ncbi:MAG TPA: rod shape-determining protein MreD [Geobacteraceae bacterium]
MIKFLKIVMIVYAALLVQVTLLPAYLADPFKPDILILFVAWLGLRGGGWRGGVLAFLLGLIADCFSGLYLGLNAFSFLFIYLVLRKVADRLYTDSLYLMVLVVSLATFVNGFVHLLLLLLFSVADGVYATLLPGLIPQALVNALAASLLFGAPSYTPREESR